MPRLAVRVKPGPRHPPLWFTPEFPSRRRSLAGPRPASRPDRAATPRAAVLLTEIQEIGGCLGSPPA